MSPPLSLLNTSTVESHIDAAGVMGSALPMPLGVPCSAVTICAVTLSATDAMAAMICFDAHHVLVAGFLLYRVMKFAGASSGSWAT